MPDGSLDHVVTADGIQHLPQRQTDRRLVIDEQHPRHGLPRRKLRTAG
jgi:hypothetical protein